MGWRDVDERHAVTRGDRQQRLGELGVPGESPAGLGRQPEGVPDEHLVLDRGRFGAFPLSLLEYLRQARDQGG